MSKFDSQPHDDRERTLNRSYTHALSWVMVGWVIGVVVVALVVSHRDDGLLWDSLVIALASGAIACLSMLPGVLGGNRQARSDGDSMNQCSRFSVCLFAGMTIRLTGTVALFLTCRYHMATSTEMIAGMTIGWYVLLTSLEVLVLARELPKTDKALPFPETSLG